MNAYTFPGLITSQQQAVEIVCKEFDTTQKELMTRNRKGNVAMARHVIVFLLIEKFNMKLQQAGFMLGRHHATIIHSVKTIKNLMQVDKEIKNKVNKILKRIRT